LVSLTIFVHYATAERCLHGVPESDNDEQPGHRAFQRGFVTRLALIKVPAQCKKLKATDEVVLLISAGHGTARSSQAGVHVPEEQPDVLGVGAGGVAPEARGPAAAADHAGGERGRRQRPITPPGCRAAVAAVRRHAEEEERRRDEEAGERQHRRREHSGEPEREAARRQGEQGHAHAAGKEGEKRYQAAVTASQRCL